MNDLTTIAFLITIQMIVILYIYIIRNYLKVLNKWRNIAQTWQDAYHEEKKVSFQRMEDYMRLLSTPVNVYLKEWNKTYPDVSYRISFGKDKQTELFKATVTFTKNDQIIEIPLQDIMSEPEISLIEVNEKLDNNIT